MTDTLLFLILSNLRVPELYLKCSLTAGLVKYLQDHDMAASASAILSYRYGCHYSLLVPMFCGACYFTDDLCLSLVHVLVGNN